MKIRKPQKQKTLDPGTELFSIATGRIDIMRKDSRKASEFISKQEGFLAVNPLPEYTLWFFDSLNHAKAARNMMKAKGVQTGDNICKLIISADGIPEPCSKVKEEFVVG